MSTSSEKKEKVTYWQHVCTFFRLCADENKQVRKNVSRRDLCAKLMSYHDRNDAYSLLRLIAPLYDRERVYWVKEKAIAKSLQRVLALANNSLHVRRMLRWKVKVEGLPPGAAVGSFADVVGEVVRDLTGGQQGKSGRLTVRGVNELLDALCSASGQRAEVDAVFRRLVLECNHEEIQWFVAVVLKDLKIHFGPDAVLKCYHPQAPECFSACMSLAKVAVDCVKPDRVLPRIDITLDLPVLPMLAARAGSHKDVAALLSDPNRDYAVETKYDGERIQIHCRAGRVRLFTRRGNEYTDHYASSLRAPIAACVRADDYILDGEVLAWDNDEKRYVPFGGNRAVALDQHRRDQEKRAERNKRAKRQQKGEGKEGKGKNDGGDGVDGIDKEKDDDGDGDGDGDDDDGDGDGDGGMDDDDDDDAPDGASRGPSRFSGGFDMNKVVGGIGSNCHMCFMCFDVLMLNGENVMGRTLRDRRSLLAAVVTEQAHRFELSGSVPVSTVEQVSELLDAACDRRDEGIMIKDLNYPYAPNERGDHWIKLKPEYLDYGEPMDLIVMGGRFGSRKDKDGEVLLSSFILGVRESAAPAAPGRPQRFLSCGKVGTGYSLTDLAMLAHRYRGRLTVQKPSAYIVSDRAKSDSVPERWFPPGDAPVFQVTCPELVPSECYAAGHTIRFPRVEVIRTDKDPSMSLDLEQFLAYATRVRAARKNDDSGKASAAAKRKRVSEPGQRGASVSEKFRGADMSDVVVGASFLAGFVCVVVSDADKRDTERMCHAAGATVWQNPPKSPGNRRCVVVTSTPSVARAVGYIRSGLYDVVSTEWVKTCAKRGRLVWPPPAELTHARSQRTASEIEATDVAVRQLRVGMAMHSGASNNDHTDTKSDQSRHGSEIDALEAEEILLGLPGLRPVDLIFFRCVMYFDRWADPLAVTSGSEPLRSPEVDAAMCVAIRYGARIADSIMDTEITHVIIDPEPGSVEMRVPIVKGALRKANPRREAIASRARVVKANWVHECVDVESLFATDNTALVNRFTV